MATMKQEEIHKADPSSSSQDARLAALEEQLRDLTARLAAVESMAHSEHTLSSEGVNQIASHVMGQVKEHLHKSLGHSGMPSVG